MTPAQRPDRLRHRSGTRLACLAVGALTASCVLSSCNRGGSDSSSSTQGSSDVKIAIATRDFTNPYWAALRKGAVDEGKSRDVTVDVQAGQSETDAAGENQQISTLATQNYNCFGVVPVNATNVITPLIPVARKKVPILNLDSQVSTSASKKAGVSYASFIGSDNIQAGMIAGQQMVKALGGKGQVAILQGIAGEQNGINRETGFGRAVAGKLDIVQKAPADYEESKGLQVTQALLRAHPHLSGIFSANDTMALGAVQAIKNAGMTGKVKVISVDGIQQALTLVKSGALYGTVTQYPYAEGQLAVESCIALHEGKKLPTRIVSPIAFIDKANVAQQIKTFPKPFKPFADPVKKLIK